jgi:MoaA/NifB/PqqE/SkfB family radical SAM enzyme
VGGDGAGLGALGTLRIKFQGGEPTLRKDFRQLCATAQQSGIRTAVVTNGLRADGAGAYEGRVFSVELIARTMTTRSRLR